MPAPTELSGGRGREGMQAPGRGENPLPTDTMGWNGSRWLRGAVGSFILGRGEYGTPKSSDEGGRRRGGFGAHGPLGQGEKKFSELRCELGELGGNSAAVGASKWTPRTGSGRAPPDVAQRAPTRISMWPLGGKRSRCPLRHRTPPPPTHPLLPE